MDEIIASIRKKGAEKLFIKKELSGDDLTLLKAVFPKIIIYYSGFYGCYIVE